jgi:hypothetical protein
MRRAGHSSLSESTCDTPRCSGISEEGASTNTTNSQGKKKRQHGNEAVKSHILAAKTVANIVKTSLVCPHSLEATDRNSQHPRDLADSTRS